jgi:hypothetical protein
MKFFSKIESVFHIPGRGCVLVPAEPVGVEFPFSLRENDAIQLRGLLGVIETHVAAIESLNVELGPPRIAILLPGNFGKEDVSSEAEVWANPSVEPISGT